MKKLIPVLIIGFAFASLTSLGFTRSDKYQASPDKKDNLQSKQQQKMEVAEKVTYTCPMHPEVMQDKPGKCPTCKMNLVKKDVYTCPMHANVIQDKPGKCPECKMNLVKKEVSKAVYFCPMHADVTQEKPGKCPKCKMALEKKETPQKAELKTM